MSVAIISIRFAVLYFLLITFQKKLSGQEKFFANQKKIISGIIYKKNESILHNLKYNKSVQVVQKYEGVANITLICLCIFLTNLIAMKP